MAQSIEIVRGTTNNFSVTITDADGHLYPPVAGEKIIFGIKKKADDPEPLVAKVATFQQVGVYLIGLHPNDTKDLDVGKYFFDVAVQAGNEYHNVIKPAPFIILANATSWGCTD